MRQLEEEVHGGLDLHLHRASPHLCQPLQADVLLHGEGGGDVPGGSHLRESSAHLRPGRQHVQEHDHRQREPVRHHQRGERGREDRCCQVHHGLHLQDIRGRGQSKSRQECREVLQPSPGSFWQCKNDQKQ